MCGGSSRLHVSSSYMRAKTKMLQAFSASNSRTILQSLKFANTICTVKVVRWYSSGYNAAIKEESLLDMTPHKFQEWLKKRKIRRCFAAFDRRANHVKVSHPELEELKRYLDQSNCYHNHEAIFLGLGLRTNNLMCAFIWKTTRGLSVSLILFVFN